MSKKLTEEKIEQIINDMLNEDIEVKYPNFDGQSRIKKLHIFDLDDPKKKEKHLARVVGQYAKNSSREKEFRKLVKEKYKYSHGNN